MKPTGKISIAAMRDGMEITRLVSTIAFACAFILLAAAPTVLAQPGAETLEGRIIKEIIFRGEGIKYNEQLRNILPFKEGDPFSLENIAKGMNLLKKTGFFQTTRWEAEPMNDGVRIVITLTPVIFIKQIEFEKTFPLFENELRRNIRVREGDPFDYDLIKKDEERLKKYLEDQGYFQSEVEARAEQDAKTGDVVLIFRLKKGFTYNLFDVRPHGNKAFSDFYIRTLVRRRMILRYRKEALDLAVEDIIKRYNARGYYEARIRVSKIELNDVLRTVVVYFDVHEGRRAKVRIKGDRHVWGRTLRKRMVLVQEQSIDEFDVETSAMRMEELYRSRGFRNVKVTYTVEQKETDEGTLYIITFNIKPGFKVIVRKVDFLGREEFRSGKLQKQILTGRRKNFWRRPVLVDAVLKEDVRALEAFYKSWGYESAQVATPELQFSKKGKKVKVVIPITEGPQTVVANVTFAGMEFFEADETLAILRLVPGAVFNPEELEKDKQRLLRHYANHGFPYALVKQEYETVKREDRVEVNIKYEVIEDLRVRVGEVLLRGNYRTKPRVLRREVELSPGEPFSREALLASRRNLRTLPFLYSVRLDTLGLEEHLDIVHLLLLVQESRARSIDFGLGYDSELGPLASLSVKNLNLLGLGKSGKLTLSGGGKLNEAELTYSDPRFLGLRLRADLTGSFLYYDRPAFDLTQAATRFTLLKKLTERTLFTPQVRAEWNLLSHVIDQEAVDDLEVSENTLLAAGPEFLYDTRDDFIDPSKGWLINGKVEYGQEFINQDNWVKFFSQATAYMSGESDIVFVVSARYGHIEPIGSSLIPIQEAFFVGGGRSVRGYSEDGLGPRSPDGDPTGGLDMIITNIELRFPIYSVFRGVLFVDSGQLVSGIKELSPDNQLFTVGAGLRVYTPVGPIRLDWGYKLEPSHYEKRYHWHFSFGYPF